MNANIFFSFIFQFLFERVEGISRATIIDLDAHQVSRYHYICLCQCASLLRSWHSWQDNSPLLPPCRSMRPKLALTVIFSGMHLRSSAPANSCAVFNSPELYWTTTGFVALMSAAYIGQTMQSVCVFVGALPFIVLSHDQPAAQVPSLLLLTICWPMWPYAVYVSLLQYSTS